MTSPTRKLSITKQAGPEKHRRSRGENNGGDTKDVVTEMPGDQVLSSCKQRSANSGRPAQVERVRIQQNASAMIDLTEDTDANIGATGMAFEHSELPKTPGPGSKRSSAQLETNNVDELELKINSRAIYDANKDEINTWYDKKYSKRLGIPKYHKIKHSDDPWYQKLDAWQKDQGHSKSPKKKHKLDNGTAQDTYMQLSSANPRQVRLEGDLVSVPEYPFDSLEDFEMMPNGNYACSHINRNPPSDCCKTGMTKHAKIEAIKKSKGIWKKQVERLIDAGKLNPAHKYWENWMNLKLREKYQPALFREQQEKKSQRKREKQGKKRANAEIEKGRVAADHGWQQIRQRPPTQQLSAMHPHHHYSVYSASNNGSQLSMTSYSSRPIPSFRCEGISNDIAATQASFLVSLTRVNPRQLRQHDALYRDAQYREFMKETPDFALLKKWYLAYFLRDQGQVLSAEQQKLLEEQDPSNVGRKRVGASPTLTAVDSFLSEYFQATKDVTQALDSVATGGVQTASKASQTVNQMTSMSTLRAGSSTPAVTPEFQATSSAPSAARVEPFELWDPERIDSELDRILVMGPMF